MGPVKRTRSSTRTNALEFKTSKNEPVQKQNNGAVLKRKTKSKASSSNNRSTSAVKKQNCPPHFQEHPLFNSLILLKILDYSQPNLDELKQLRLVCKAWHNITLPKWRSTAVIQLVPDPPLFRKRRENEITAGEHLNEIQNKESPYQLTEVPYKCYKFNRINIDVSVCDEEGDSKVFWKMIGPHVEYVHFENCVFIDSMDKPLIQLLVRKLPNLKHLALTDVTIGDGIKEAGVVDNEDDKMRKKRYKSFRESHLNLKTLTVQGGIFCADPYDLFTHAPNLESIFGMDGEKYKIDYDNFMSVGVDAILGYCHCELKKPKNRLKPLSNLKHLDLVKTSTFIECNDLEDCYESMAESKLSLETFMATLRPDKFKHLGFRPPPPGCSSDVNIDKFLASIAPTLQVLKLFRAPFCQPYPSFLCETEMTALRELHLWGTITPRLHFLKCTPNLEFLYINLACFEKRKEMQDIIDRNEYENSIRFCMRYKRDMVECVCMYWMEGTMLGNLHTLHIDYNFPAKSLEMMAEWMPNLKSLKTILTKSTVPVVCEQWKDLTELVCLFGSTIENHNLVCNNNYPKRRRLTASSSTIGDLKDLERFQFDSLCGESTLSDACVINGFLKMPALKSVQICVSKKMSTKAEEMLKKQFGSSCRVIRNYMGGDHSNYDCCERRNFVVFCCKRTENSPEPNEEERNNESALSSSSSSDSE